MKYYNKNYLIELFEKRKKAIKYHGYGRWQYNNILYLIERVSLDEPYQGYCQPNYK